MKRIFSRREKGNDMGALMKKIIDLIAGVSTIKYSEYASSLRGTGTTLIDVRTPAEFAESHLPEAINVPLDKLTERYTEINNKNRVVTVCAHGIRSAKAAKFLVMKGYKAESLAGGMAQIPDKEK
jgi:phage shock protein E